MPNNSRPKTTKYAQLWLNYYKQGDDMQKSIVKNSDDKTDAKASINNHIALLESVIDHLKKVNELIPNDNDIEIDGNSHFIELHGNIELIQKMQDEQLLQSDCKDCEDDEYEDDEYEDETEEDEESTHESEEQNKSTETKSDSDADTDPKSVTITI